MAQQLSASIYGQNGNSWGNPQGEIMGFPTQGIVIRTLNPPVTLAGVVCNSQIQLLPYGPSPNQPLYFCPTAAATLITAANA
jgi:hypothetical protein